MREALCHFYLGRGSKKECFDAVKGCSETTYYRIKDEHPELAEAIDHSARREALYRTSGEQIAFQARQKRRSRAIQEWAMDVLADPRVQEVLLSIILGEPRTVVVGDEERYIIPRPADRIRAFKALLDLARCGCLPETEVGIDDIIWAKPPADERDEDSLDWLIGVGVPVDFETIAATTPDGRDVKATVAPPRSEAGTQF
jgi:hypothetical protein